MVTKDQLSVGMQVMARDQFENDIWYSATVTDLKLTGVNPIVGLDIHYQDKGGWLRQPSRNVIVSGLRHVNDIRLLSERC